MKTTNELKEQLESAESKDKVIEKNNAAGKEV